MYEEAIPLILKDIAVAINTNTNLNNLVYTYNMLIRCYLNTDKFEDVVKTFKAMETHVSKLPNNSIMVGYLKNKAIYYNNIKKTDSSNYYFEKAFMMLDSIDMKRYAQIFSSNELSYKISENNKKIAKHKINLKNQVIKLKKRQQNILIFFTVVLLILNFYKMHSVKKSRAEVKEKNNQILKKNKEINQALSEKDILLKEVHHRVKNNLQLISGLLELQNIPVTNNSIRIALKEGQNRIQSVALVHKMMYQSKNVSKVDMQKHLTELTQVLQHSYESKNQQISTKIVANGVDLNITLAVPISLIVNEAVCNIYKHAFNNRLLGSIEIKLFKINETAYKLVIEDNGNGLPENFNLSNLKSIGFDLIKGLSKQIKGKLQVTSNKGTVISIIFNKL